ncbi:MAG: hypothetical protein LBH52_01990 [Puniceicoccales bacterium]|nr:hypothetical protein [Puniceicoccales bacterium]
MGRDVRELFDLPKPSITEDQRLLEAAFNKLIKLSSGQAIVDRLCRLISEKRKSKIKVERGGLGVDLTKDKKADPCIRGVDKLSKSQSCCFLGPWDEIAKAYQVALSEVPPCIVLGHELIHLIDGLENPGAFVSGTRTLQNWIDDNQDNEQILTILQDPYFKKIFVSNMNIYEELYVYFGTNESRGNGIPTENCLLLEAGIGLKVGYSPTSDNFFISKQLGDALLVFYNGSSKLCSPSSEFRFNLDAALRSPLYFRTQGIGKTNTLVEQLGAKWIDGSPLSSGPLLTLGFRAGKRAQHQEKTTFIEAYKKMTADIDEKRFSLPLPILWRPDITLAYYYGSRVSFNLYRPLSITDDVKIKFEFTLQDGTIRPFKFPLPSNRSEIVFNIGILPSIPQRVEASIIRKVRSTKEILWEEKSCNTIVPVESPLGFLFFDLYILPSISPLPTLPKESPKTVLGLIRYEQFYNKYQKLLLQVGDGTSLEETIRLYDQIYTPTDNFSTLESEISRSREISHSRISWDKVLKVAKISIETDLVTPNGDLFARDAAKYKVIQNKLTLDGVILNRNLHLYQCDSQGRELLSKPLQFGEGPTVEVVQDVRQIPNVYFLVVDTNSLPPSPKVQSPKRPKAPGDRSVTPKVRKSDRGSPPSPSSTTPRLSTKPKPPVKSASEAKPKPKSSPSPSAPVKPGSTKK